MFGCLIELLIYIIYENELTKYFCNCCPYNSNDDEKYTPFLQNA